MKISPERKSLSLQGRYYDEQAEHMEFGTAMHAMRHEPRLTDRRNKPKAHKDSVFLFDLAITRMSGPTLSAEDFLDETFSADAFIMNARRATTLGSLAHSLGMRCHCSLFSSKSFL